MLSVMMSLLEAAVYFCCFSFANLSMCLYILKVLKFSFFCCFGFLSIFGAGYYVYSSSSFKD